MVENWREHCWSHAPDPVGLNVSNVAPSISGAPSFCLVCETCSGGYTARRRLNHPGGFGDCTCMSASWRHCVKPIGWSNRCLYHFTRASVLSEDAQTARSLCSTNIAPRHRSYGALRHPLPLQLIFSALSVIRFTDRPAAFVSGGEGLLQLFNASLSPCSRYHPPE